MRIRPINTHLHTYIYTYTHIHMHAYIYIYIYTMHTYLHFNIFPYFANSLLFWSFCTWLILVIYSLTNKKYMFTCLVFCSDGSFNLCQHFEKYV